MVRCRYILRVTLVYVSFSSFWFSFLTRTRARGGHNRRIAPIFVECWSCLFERSASFDLNSTEKEVHQHVFSFEGIRARESTLSAHPPSPSICLSLSLPFKREESEGTIQFFAAIQIWEIGRKKGGGKENRNGPKFGTLFFLFWMNFGTMHFCCYVLNGGGDLQKI